MRKILFLGAPMYQIPVIQKAKEMGLYVGVMDINEKAPAIKYADEYLKCSLRDKKAALEEAKKFIPDGVICGACDTCVQTCAYICSHLNLPCFSENVALNSTNKLEMIEKFAACNVPHPKYQVVSKQNVEKFSNLQLSFPIISKPTDSAGGRGVYLINNREELHYILSSSKAGISGDVILEEFVSGPEVSVEIVILEGEVFVLQITDKLTSGPPNFFEIGHCQPSALDAEIKKQIIKVASEAVLAVGLFNSVAHVEIKISSEGPKLIELGARMGGDCITTYLLNNSISGICMSEIAIKLAMGEKIERPKYKNSDCGVAIKFIPSKDGKLMSIKNNIDNKYENLIKVDIFGQVGKKYSKAIDDTARIGYVIAKSNNVKNALKEVDSAIEDIEIKYDVMEE